MGKVALALASCPFFDIESLQEAVGTLLEEKGINEDEQFSTIPNLICRARVGQHCTRDYRLDFIARSMLPIN